LEKKECEELLKRTGIFIEGNKMFLGYNSLTTRTLGEKTKACNSV
jgi:hypothetical protein